MDGYEVSISYTDMYYCARKGVDLSEPTMQIKLETLLNLICIIVRN